MLFRQDKKKEREVSLNEPIGKDKEGNEISLKDIIGEDSEKKTAGCSGRLYVL